MYMNVKQKKKAEWSAGQVGTPTDWKMKRQAVSSLRLKCCTNDEGGYFCPEDHEGGYMASGSNSAERKSGMNRWCW